jgi:hypothetical protein
MALQALRFKRQVVDPYEELLLTSIRPALADLSLGKLVGKSANWDRARSG